MQNSKQLLGASGEEIAVDYLISQGYVVFDRNWRSKSGEIDIVASEKFNSQDELIFIEVKTRSSRDYGDPIEAISATILNNDSYLDLITAPVIRKMRFLYNNP